MTKTVIFWHYLGSERPIILIAETNSQNFKIINLQSDTSYPCHAPTSEFNLF